MYTSAFCGHSRAVERFMGEQGIPVELVNVDNNPEGRAKLKALNNGYASVPTLIFPDGAQLTEPSLSELRLKLGMEVPGFLEKILGAFGKGSP
jgi:mycoredoxin